MQLAIRSLPFLCPLKLLFMSLLLTPTSPSLSYLQPVEFSVGRHACTRNLVLYIHTRNTSTSVVFFAIFVHFSRQNLRNIHDAVFTSISARVSQIHYVKRCSYINWVYVVVRLWVFVSSFLLAFVLYVTFVKITASVCKDQTMHALQMLSINCTCNVYELCLNAWLALLTLDVVCTDWYAFAVVFHAAVCIKCSAVIKQWVINLSIRRLASVGLT